MMLTSIIKAYCVLNFMENDRGIIVYCSGVVFHFFVGDDDGLVLFYRRFFFVHTYLLHYYLRLLFIINLVVVVGRRQDVVVVKKGCTASGTLPRTPESKPYFFRAR